MSCLGFTHRYELFKSLDISGRQRDVMNRVIDLRKLVRGARSELEILQKMRDVINNKKLEDVYKDVEGKLEFLSPLCASNRLTKMIRVAISTHKTLQATPSI